MLCLSVFMASLELVRLEGQPYFNFINSLKTQATKKEYRRVLLGFMKQYSISALDNLVS